MNNDNPPPADRSGDLLERLNDRLRNALYWMTESKSPEQAQSAILEARGIAMVLAEKHHRTTLPLFNGRSNERLSNGGRTQ